jgi:hypothetical protein
MSSVFREARRLRDAGLSIIPIRADGSKVATVLWKIYQSRLPTDAELTEWFRRPAYGLAVIAGAISGGLEILDFDAADIFAPWADLLEELSPGLLQRLPVVRTPTSGRHVYYRCATIVGNQKVSQHSDAKGRPVIDIETRGEGGYVLAPECPLACHPLGKPYVLLDGDLADIPRLSPEERALLLHAARSFNEYVEPERTMGREPQMSTSRHHGDRPGDAYNAYMTWPEILEPRGWTRVYQRGELTLWKRPGKRERGWSATTNYAGTDLLYVFSSNAFPFEPDHAYSKFAAYTLLHHAGDFMAAVKALANEGYGDRNGVTAGDGHAPPYSGYRGYRGYRGLRRG